MLIQLGIIVVWVVSLVTQFKLVVLCRRPPRSVETGDHVSV